MLIAAAAPPRTILGSVGDKSYPRDFPVPCSLDIFLSTWTSRIPAAKTTHRNNIYTKEPPWKPLVVFDIFVSSLEKKKFVQKILFSSVNSVYCILPKLLQHRTLIIFLACQHLLFHIIKIMKKIHFIRWVENNKTHQQTLLITTFANVNCCLFMILLTTHYPFGNTNNINSVPGQN